MSIALLETIWSKSQHNTKLAIATYDIMEFDLPDVFINDLIECLTMLNKCISNDLQAKGEFFRFVFDDLRGFLRF